MTVDITTSTPDEVLAAVRGWRRSTRAPLNARMGIEVIEASAERLVATMPVEATPSPTACFTVSASVVLAETLGSIGSALHAGPDKVVVGVDINATHHRPRTPAGHRRGHPLSVGRTRASWEIVITDEEGKRVCTSRITCLIAAPPGA